MVTEILARVKCGLLWCLRSIFCPWRDPLDLHRDNPAVACSSQRRPWFRNRCSECIVVGSQWTTDSCASVFVFLFNGFMSLASYFVFYVQILILQKPHISASINMYLVINKWVIAVKISNFSGHYLRNRSTLDIGVLGYIGIVWPK